MAFGILLRHPDSLSVGAFEALLEDSAYALTHEKPGTDWSDAHAVDASFGRRPPKALVNFIPEDLNTIDQQHFDELGALVSVCAQRNIPLLHVSSYRVYGVTETDRSIRETDEAEPEDDLGKKILQLEKILQAHRRHVILRPSWILEGSGGVLNQFMPPLLARQELVVSDHRYGAPVSRRYIVRVLFAMIQQILCGAENWGVFNVHSSDKCSEAEFADQLFRLLVNEFKLEVNAPTVAGPKDDRHLLEGCAHLVGRRCTANFGIQLPTWRSGFARVVKAWLDESLAR